MDGRDRLFRYDRRIAANTIASTFARWPDRVIAAIILCGLSMAARSWSTGHAWSVAIWSTLGIGLLAGAGTARALSARVDFHATEGLLAADALRPTSRRRYVAAWHGVGLLLLMTLMLIAAPSLCVPGTIGYVVGAIVANSASGLLPAGIASRGATGRRTLDRMSVHPMVGIAAATGFVLTLVVTAGVGTEARLAVCGMVTLLLLALLTTVDDGVVRFRTIAGESAAEIVAHRARPALMMVAFALAATWLVVGRTAAMTVAAVSLAMLILMVQRILLYRCHAKRTAGVLILLFAAVLVLIAVATPLLLPLATAAILGRSWHRAAQRTWLLA